MKVSSAPVILDEIPAPSAPSAGSYTIYVDVIDGKLKIKKSDSTVVALESGLSDQIVLAQQIFN